MEKGTLYLIPNTLGENEPSEVIPKMVYEIVRKIKNYLVEDKQTMVRYLERFGVETEKLNFQLLNKYTDEKIDVSTLLSPLMKGEDLGIISNSGCPCIADPGSKIVSIAHERRIKVVPLVGPSSIILSLMASGFNGQNFSFYGYLPKKKEERIRKLKEIEIIAKKFNQTQIFIEAPHRNNELLKEIFSTCSPSTRLCIATDITLPTESIISKSIKDWKFSHQDIHKKPSVFLIY